MLRVTICQSVDAGMWIEAKQKARSCVSVKSTARLRGVSLILDIRNPAMSLVYGKADGPHLILDTRSPTISRVHGKADGPRLIRLSLIPTSFRFRAEHGLEPRVGHTADPKRNATARHWKYAPLRDMFLWHGSVLVCCRFVDYPTLHAEAHHKQHYLLRVTSQNILLSMLLPYRLVVAH